MNKKIKKSNAWILEQDDKKYLSVSLIEHSPQEVVSELRPYVQGNIKIKPLLKGNFEIKEDLDYAILTDERVTAIESMKNNEEVKNIYSSIMSFFVDNEVFDKNKLIDYLQGVIETLKNE